MKNRLFLFLSLAAFIGGLTSCVTSREYAETREYDVNRNPVQNRAMVAEYKVDLSSKIKGSGAVTNGTVENAKNLALWNAITSNGADAIADPIYKVNQEMTVVTVEVQGFKANFKDIRIATKQDLIDYISLLISTNGIQSISYQMFKVYYQEKESQSEIPEENRLTDEEIEALWKELSLNNSSADGTNVMSSTTRVVEDNTAGKMPYSGKTGKQIWKQDVKPLKIKQRVSYLNKLHPKDRKSYNKFVAKRALIGALIGIPVGLLVSLIG